MENFNIKFQTCEESFLYLYTGSLESAIKYAENKLQSDFIWTYNGIRECEIYVGRILVYTVK